MPEPACATCRFFVPLGGGGNCYRLPPTDRDQEIVNPAEMWCGEHTPRQPAAVAGLPAPMPLPDGWTWRGERVVGPRGVEVFADDEGDLVISGHWFAPIAVVEAAIAAHRHRVGGAA